MATLVSERNVAHASRAGAHSYGYQPAVNEFSHPSYVPSSYRSGTAQRATSSGAASTFEAATVGSLSVPPGAGTAAPGSLHSSSSLSPSSDAGSDSDLTANAKPFRRKRPIVNGYYTPQRGRPGGGLSSEGKYSAPHHRQNQQQIDQQRHQQHQRLVDGAGGQSQQQHLVQEQHKGQVQLLPKTYVEPDGKTHYLTEQERIPRLTPAGQVVYITRYAENVPNLRIAQ